MWFYAIVAMRKFFISLYQIFIWLPLFLLFTIIVAIVTVIGCLLGSEKVFSYYPCKIWSRFNCIITFCRIKVTGKEKLKKNQSYVFVANHQGIYDCWLIFGYLGIPIKWIMKRSLRKIPFVGKACELSGFIFVDDSSPMTRVKAIYEAKEKFKNGASIAIFPEGSRTATGKLGKFKNGAFRIALDLQLPIVPITLNGSYEVMPRNTIFICPHRMEIIIHDPISTADLIPMAPNIHLLSDKAWKKIESSLWEQYRSD